MARRLRITWGWGNVSEFLAWTAAIGLAIGSFLRTGKIDYTLYPFIFTGIGWVPYRRGVEGLKRRAQQAVREFTPPPETNDDEGGRS